MPSIFIWKSDSPNTSSKQIRYYTGSNWVLEDYEYSSKSYQFLEQTVIPGFDDSVITFNVKQMPTDWVGNELLEVTCIPYEQIKSDNYGTLDKIGEWMRFTLKQNIDFFPEILEQELVKIKKWMSEKHEVKYDKSRMNNQKQVRPNNTFKPNNKILNMNNNILDPNKIHLDFEKFLIQYNICNLRRN
jgi:hypothetical protein